LFIKKLSFDGFYPLLVVLKIDFCCCLKKKLPVPVILIKI